VIAPALHRAIESEMLDAGHQAVRVAQRLALIGLDHRPRDFGYEVRIFTEAFGSTPPARVAGDVDHGCEGHVQAVGAGFDGGNTPGTGNGLHIPTGRQPHADGEDGAVPMDYV